MKSWCVLVIACPWLAVASAAPKVPATAPVTPAVAATPTSAPPMVAATAKPPSPLINVIETLYQKQLFEAADVVLGLAFNSNELDAADRSRLLVMEGILRMEAFQEPQATKAFRDALELDRLLSLPEFAPPKTRRLFEDVKATLPAPKVVPIGPIAPLEAHPEPSTGPGLLPWIPIGIGGAALLTGGGFVVASRMVDGQLRSGSSDIKTRADLDAAVSRGQTFQTTGYVLVGAGGAVLLGGLLWKLSPEFMPLFSLQVVPNEHGFATVFSGPLP